MKDVKIQKYYGKGDFLGSENVTPNGSSLLMS